MTPDPGAGGSAGDETPDARPDGGPPGADLFDLLEGMLGGGADNALGALGGLGDVLRQAQSLGQQEVTGQAGGGVVKVTMSGDFDVRSVQIDPAAVDPDDVAMLEDLVLAAFRDAADAARRLAFGGLGGGVGGRPGLPGLPGVGPPEEGDGGPT